MDNCTRYNPMGIIVYYNNIFYFRLKRNRNNKVGRNFFFSFQENYYINFSKYFEEYQLYKCH